MMTRRRRCAAQLVTQRVPALSARRTLELASAARGGPASRGGHTRDKCSWPSTKWGCPATGPARGEGMRDQVVHTLVVAGDPGQGWSWNFVEECTCNVQVQ